MRIYNLFPLLAGRFADWHPHLGRAADLGFDWVFVNPIQYPGYSGSLYSIKDYFRFNPLFLDDPANSDPLAQFRAVADAARALNLKLMVDLVVNHCAFDSPLTTEHPRWFQRHDGKLVHPSCQEGAKRTVWKDLVQFDHRHAPDKDGLFNYVLGVVEFLCSLGFRGFRCDAAYQVPPPFWERLIREIRRRHPGTLFLAETLGCVPAQTVQTARAGFDAIFNSAKWWDFHSPWLLEQYSLTREAAGSVAFPESHDTPRLAAELDGNLAGIKQRCFFAALFSAGFLMPMGFEFGHRKRLHVVQTRAADWETPHLDLTGFVRQLNRAKARHPIFNEDAPTEILHQDNPNILFLWKGSPRARQEALIILNKDIWNPQRFFTHNLYDHVQDQRPLTDVSPEYPLDYLPTPYEYVLRPGQGIALVTGKTPP
jgi:starch synthase (maltosyl-transferring)